jgi:type II secretory ATPase GspE/PulE/Tfp pilus assembly ATPase PilB-like protein
MSKDLLIVDDEPKICGALKALFEERGFRVATASTAQAALEQFRCTPAEVVLLDLRLPDCSGLDVLSQMKEQVPSLRVVVISGLTDQHTIHEALQRGASGYLTKPFDFTRCFYAAMGIETVDLTAVQAEPEALARVPVSVAQQYRVIPLRVRHKTLELAVGDPLDVQHLDELKALLGCQIKPLAAIGEDPLEAIHRCYGIGADWSKRVRPSQPLELSTPLEEASGRVVEEPSKVTQLVNELIEHAYANRATDLHLGIGSQGVWIRERIDGMVLDVPVASQWGTLYRSVVSRIKAMANLDIAQHRLPQDGRGGFELGSTKLDLRVSVLPTLHGENLAIRPLEPSRTFQLDQLGMSQEQLRHLESVLAKPTGLLLVTGPTGSGKSTSLYAFLSTLNTGCANILTLEDPIEHELAGVTQIQVHSKIGLTFADGLRSMLRHDPDIIMVGEIRDPDTASLAVRAAMTGHLVLSTLHTNDAASGVTRLLDLGIEPFLLCSTVSGIVSQRLLRQLCVECREPAEVDVASLSQMGVIPPARTGIVRVWRARSCASCRNTGYHGRTGVFELLPIDHHIRSLIIKRSPSAQIRQSAISKGMRSLWQIGWQKVQAGVTSLDELIRVLPPHELG